MLRFGRSGTMALAACMCMLPLRSAGGDETAPRVQAPATSAPEKLVLTVGKSIALGYVPKELAVVESGFGFEIEILGERRAAVLQWKALYDPEGMKMRGS